MERSQEQPAFRFENYKISEFYLNEPLDNDDRSLSIDLKPSGIYFKSQKRYFLQIELEAKIKQETEEEHTILKATMNSSFMIQGDFEKIDYFYQNSIAISFPFLRAFISTLTLQANVTQLILPIANLTYLEQPLREATQIVED